MFSLGSPSSTNHLSLRTDSPSTSALGNSILENLSRSKLYHSLSSLDKTKLWSKFYVEYDGVKKVLDAVSSDQKVVTDPHLNRRRRTVIISRRENEPFGFTLQTYLLKRAGQKIADKVTYVDYVQLDSPADEAGVRPGDVIISINGEVVTGITHEALIKLISSCSNMRMVLIFEDNRQKIELTARAIRLRKLLNDKLYQLHLIHVEEQRILTGAYMRWIAKKRILEVSDSFSSVTTSSTDSDRSHSEDLSNSHYENSQKSVIINENHSEDQFNSSCGDKASIIDSCFIKRPSDCVLHKMCDCINIKCVNSPSLKSVKYINSPSSLNCNFTQLGVVDSPFLDPLITPIAFNHIIHLEETSDGKLSRVTRLQ